jgi:hypothetical protein
MEPLTGEIFTTKKFIRIVADGLFSFGEEEDYALFAKSTFSKESPFIF